MGPPDLGDLWRRIRARDKEAQEELYGQAARVCPHVWKRLGVPAERHQDLLHEVFLSVVDYAGRHADPPGNLPAFLKGWALASLRKYRRPVDPCESDDLADVRPGPEDVARQQELLAAVRSCAGRLKGVRREAYLLRYVRKLDRASAAREVGISVNAFDLRLFQANRAVRACLESKGFRP